MNDSILSNWLQIRSGRGQITEAPPLEDWMRASRQDVARVVEPFQLSVLIPSDGSRRHFLLRQLNEKNPSDNSREYLSAMGAQLVGLFRLLVSTGVKNILCPILQKPNFERGSDYVRQAAQATSAVLTGETFSRFYRDWKAEPRLYGAWDVLPPAEPARDILTALNQRLGALAGGNSRVILFGFCPGSFVDEMCARAALRAQSQGDMPSSEDLRRLCFPHGPENLDLVINADALRAGYIVPPVLDHGAQYYHLGYIPYDLSETNLRQILYDYLFLRRPEPDEGQNYSQAELREIQAHNTQNKNKVLGLGKRLGSGLWQLQ